MKLLLRAALAGLSVAALISPANAATRYNVTASNYKYTPNTLTISVGDTVHWQNANQAGQNHTVTNGTGSGDPNMGTLFNATINGANASFDYVFTAAGVIPVFCRPHESLNMKMTITVNSVNQPPVVNSIANQSVNENVLLTVTPVGSDPNGDVLTWSGTNLPSGSSVNAGTGVLTWTPSYAQAGLYSGVTLTANDGHGGMAAASFNITVNNVNRPPSVNGIANVSAPEQALLTITPSGSDPDGDVLTWSGTGVPSGATVNASTGLFSWTPQASDVGSVSNVTLIATDPGLLTASASFSVTVTLSPSAILVDHLPAPTALGIAAVLPSPFRSHTEIVIGTPSARAASVTVWSVTGRQIATLARGSLRAGYSRMVWNGTGRDGRAVPGGVYLLRVESGAVHVETRVIKID